MSDRKLGKVLDRQGVPVGFAGGPPSHLCRLYTDATEFVLLVVHDRKDLNLETLELKLGLASHRRVTFINRVQINSSPNNETAAVSSSARRRSTLKRLESLGRE